MKFSVDYESGGIFLNFSDGIPFKNRKNVQLNKRIS